MRQACVVNPNSIKSSFDFYSNSFHIQEAGALQSSNLSTRPPYCFSAAGGS